jgi:hypothetical protein
VSAKHVFSCWSVGENHRLEATNRPAIKGTRHQSAARGRPHRWVSLLAGVFYITCIVKHAPAIIAGPACPCDVCVWHAEGNLSDILDFYRDPATRALFRALEPCSPAHLLDSAVSCTQSARTFLTSTAALPRVRCSEHLSHAHLLNWLLFPLMHSEGKDILNFYRDPEHWRCSEQNT